MSDTPPALKRVMTPFPYSIVGSAPIEDARAMMEEHDIHHLPVMTEGVVQGMISERELAVAEALGGERTVQEVCRKRACVVDIDAPLAEVVGSMAEDRIHAAVVLRQGKLAGIFTVTDAYGLLGEFLANSGGTAGPDEVA